MHSISAAPRTALRCFASLLHKPSASCGQRPGRALSCSALREPWRSRSGAP